MIVFNSNIFIQFHDRNNLQYLFIINVQFIFYLRLEQVLGPVQDLGHLVDVLDDVSEERGVIGPSSEGSNKIVIYQKSRSRVLRGVNYSCIQSIGVVL